MTTRTEYWQRCMSRASYELETAAGAMVYRLSGDGFEYLEGQPDKKARCLELLRLIETARTQIETAEREAFSLTLGFS